MKYLISFIFIFYLSFTTFSQSNKSANTQQEYIIDNIEVSGTVYYEKANVVSWSGLKVGSVFKWPGDQAATAIKKLWDLGYFEDVQMLYTNIEDNRITL